MDSVLNSFVDQWIGLGLLGLLAAFLLVMALGGPYIRLLQRRYLGQYIREDGPQSHHSKAGTPTLGGLLILLGAAAGLSATCAISPSLMMSQPVWITVIAALLFGGLGFLDDYLKITKKHNKGITGYTKLGVQVGFGLAVGLYLLAYQDRDSLNVFYHTQWRLGIFYPIFTALVITATSNAVNITDGLDGLASSTMIISLIACSMILATTGYPEFSVLCLVLVGACAGFLVFNKNPARIFMGDTGSLALGGVLGTMMALGDAELWIPLVGSVFVMECLSVILQVASFKSTGKRIFKMAPIHHHFELCGLHETHVVWLFCAIQLLGSLIGLYINQQ